MRNIPAALQAKLDSGVTTLAHCWTLTRRDGVVLGFTDHDRDLLVDTILCRAGTGFAASEASSRFDLSIDGAEISGALDDEVLREADLVAGRFDAAGIATWLVDWSEPALKVLIARGTLGEIRREGAAFTAELRGLADLLSQERGRLYTAKCGADLGDNRCRADLGNPAWRGSGHVASLQGTSIFTTVGLESFAAGLFSGGRLSWSTGGNAGLAIEIKQHRVNAGQAVLSLWQATAEPIAPGDSFVVTAGCDKTFFMCRNRFANADNFRGFPQIPGNDFVLSYPTPGTGGDTFGGVGGGGVGG
ncbi:DUF2163 domain-containing protein [soil metagenome]